MIRPAPLLVLAAALAAPLAALATRPARAAAQNAVPADSMAWAGADGIYVWLGGTVVSPAHPVEGVVAHRLERRRPGGDWRGVADFRAVESAEALFAPLDPALQRLLPGALGQSDRDAAWAYILAHPTADSLAPIIGDRQIRRLLGIYGVDRDVKDGDRWEYRVSDVTAGGAVVRPRTSTVVAYPSTIAFTPVRTLRVEQGDSTVDVWWHIERGSHPARSLEVWRREGRDGRFEKVDSIDFFLVVGDTVQARWRDSDVGPDRQFSYYAVPRDVFFNRGAPSDTVTAYTVPLLSLSLPDSVRAAGTEEGIRVSWRYPEPERARTIRVYRSLSLDSGWVRVAEIPARDTAFTDPWMEAMRVVYYRLTVTSVRGDESPPTGAVFAHFRNPLAPAPPAGVQVGAGEGGVRLSWAPAGDAGLRGYRVYRTDAPVDTIEPGLSWLTASPLLGPADTTFLDTAALVPGRARTWAVQAISASGVASGLSHPVQLAAPPAPPPTPTGLHGRVEGGAAELLWDDMTESDLVVAGYVVLRRPAGAAGTELRPLTPQPVPAPHNAFRDTTATPGEAYEYAVRSVDYLGRSSPASAPIRLRPELRRPAPPPAPRAVPGGGGVVVTWDPVATGTVRIYRYQVGGEPGRLAEVAADAGGYADAAAAPGRRYYYRLALVLDGIESELGPEVSAKP